MVINTYIMIILYLLLSTTMGNSYSHSGKIKYKLNVSPRTEPLRCWRKKAVKIVREEKYEEDDESDIEDEFGGEIEELEFP